MSLWKTNVYKIFLTRTHAFWFAAEVKVTASIFCVFLRYCNLQNCKEACASAYFHNTVTTLNIAELWYFMFFDKFKNKNDFTKRQAHIFYELCTSFFLCGGRGIFVACHNAKVKCLHCYVVKFVLWVFLKSSKCECGSQKCENFYFDWCSNKMYVRLIVLLLIIGKSEHVYLWIIWWQQFSVVKLLICSIV